MPLKVTADQKGIMGTFIRLETIKKMVHNFVELTCKKESPEGQCKPLNFVDDSHSVHFSKNEIDTLFKENFPPNADPNEYGIRIYLGMHGSSEEERSDMPNRPPGYMNQHTVILVCTHKFNDLLEPGLNSVSQLYPQGAGLEEGQICPPPAPPCRGKLIFPQ